VSVSFTSSQVGQHQVSVTHHGRHVQGSPFSLEVVYRLVYRRDYNQVSNQCVSRFGLQGAGDGQFSYPSSVACNLRRDCDN